MRQGVTVSDIGKLNLGQVTDPQEAVEIGPWDSLTFDRTLESCHDSVEWISKLGQLRLVDDVNSLCFFLA